MGKQITDELINAVISGNYGNGTQRKDALTKAGYDYSQVQAAINNRLYGSGSSGSTSQSSSDSEITEDIGSMPTYTSKYQGQIDSLTRELLNRKAFEYNPEEDKTYQQYAKDYRRYGEMAMEDTLGKVAARTGGLASSYASSAAQQSYNSYMSALASKIPELEQLAYSMYLSEGDQLKDRLSLLSSLEANNYANYQDQLSAYLELVKKKSITPKTGETLEEITQNANKYISSGASRSEISAYLREKYNNQEINQEEFGSLRKEFLPSGGQYGGRYTY